ncbi:hypothetical protein ACEWY4_014917 [Coilia grayii]|uniref:TIR domain-containing protein n=1 Tax=Coilia grayii TaxID=363190 RepID=A0ABD1JTP3_9TELE
MADKGIGEREEQQAAVEQAIGADLKGNGVGIQANEVGSQENGAGLQASRTALQANGVVPQENGAGPQANMTPLQENGVSLQASRTDLQANGVGLQSNESDLQEIRADLQEAFRIICCTPKERLLSITLKMGASDDAEQLVRAMALVALSRPAEALRQLQELGDYCIATYLAGQVTGSQGRVENLRVDTFQLPEPRSTALRDLARIFRVLVQERLCDASLRDQAYRVALLECANRKVETRDTYSSDLGELTEEVRRVCGTEISCQALRFLSNSPRSLAASSHDGNSHSNPTSLQSSSYSSLPSHLEISAAPTQPARCAGSTRNSNTHASMHTHSAASDRLVSPVLGLGSGKAAQPRGVVSAHVPAPAPAPHPPLAPAPAMLGTYARPSAQCTGGKDGSHQLVTSVSTGVESLRLPDPVLPAFSRSVSAPEMPSSGDGHNPVFYSFVILHAPEDAEEAEELRSTLEGATSGTGATFSQDFAIPGRSTLTCLDDAIDNSAFTVLLLSRNFTTRMQEVLTDSALINSIQQRHKYNSVIPLVPRRNPLAQDSLPKVLRTIVQLKEASRTFSTNARRAISPEKVALQRRKWQEEQEARRQEESRQRLQQENRRRREEIQRNEDYQRLLQESWELHHRQQNMQRFTPPPLFHPPTASNPAPPFHHPAASNPAPPFYPPTRGRGAPSSVPSPHYPSPNPLWGPPPQGQPLHLPANISIHNAQCIMIGNDSTMTIGDPGVIQFDDEHDDD